jgi:hypothetical protein
MPASPPWPHLSPDVATSGDLVSGMVTTLNAGTALSIPGRGTGPEVLGGLPNRGA